jgi:aspartyl-tRNA(Asn)/glutamyl-tRNA(Gln) amidotransferase subunit B
MCLFCWRHQGFTEKELEKIVKDVISKNPKPVEDFKKGKENALQYLAGQVMGRTRGRAKPDTVQKLLKKLLT